MGNPKLFHLLPSLYKSSLEPITTIEPNKETKQKQLKEARNYLRNSLMPCSLNDPFRRANFILRALIAAMAGYPNPPIPSAFSSSDWAPASVHSHLEKQIGF